MSLDERAPDGPDHLELSVTNTTSGDITNFEVCYTITDPSNPGQGTIFTVVLPVNTTALT
jgi:hypothetical protein